MPIYYTILYATWGAAVLAKSAAALFMFRNGLFRKLSPTWIYLLTNALYSILLLSSRWHMMTYGRISYAGLPVILLLQCAATISIFSAITVNYPNFKMAGSVFLGAFAVAGMAVAWAVSYTSKAITMSSPAWLWAAGNFAQYYETVVVIVVLLGSLVALPKFPSISIPRYAIRAGWIMLVDAAGTLACTWFADWHGFEHPRIVAIAPVVRGLLVSLLWLSLRPGIQPSTPSSADSHMRRVALRDVARRCREIVH